MVSIEIFVAVSGQPIEKIETDVDNVEPINPIELFFVTTLLSCWITISEC